MKTKLLTLCGAAALSATSISHAAISLTLDVEVIRDAEGAPINDKGLLVLVVDTDSNGFSQPIEGSIIPAGSGDQIVTSWDLGTKSIAADQAYLMLTQNGIPYSESWVAGRDLALIWFPNMAEGDVPSADEEYGFFTDAYGLARGAPWALPADHTLAYGLKLLTSAATKLTTFGDFPAAIGSALYATNQPAGQVDSITTVTTTPEGDKIKINWAGGASNGGSYVIQRSRPGTGNWRTVGFAVNGATTFDDDTISPGLDYEYRVLSANGFSYAFAQTLETVEAERSVFEFVSSRAQIVNGGHAATSKLTGRVRIEGNDPEKTILIQALGPHHRAEFGNRWVSNTRMELFWHDEADFNIYRLDGDNTNWMTNENALEIDQVMHDLSVAEPNGAKEVRADDPTAIPPYVDKNSMLLVDLESNIDYTFRTTSLEDSGNSWIGIFDTEYLDPEMERDNRIVNLQVRGYMGPDNSEFSDLDRFNGGVKIRGNVKKTVLLVAWGPTLTANTDDSHNLPAGQELKDPLVRLYRFGNSTPIAENDDWQIQSGDPSIVNVNLNHLNQALASKNYNLLNGSKDAALLVTLDPGNYLFRVFGDGAPGVSVIDLDEIELEF